MLQPEKSTSLAPAPRCVSCNGVVFIGPRGRVAMLQNHLVALSFRQWLGAAARLRAHQPAVLGRGPGLGLNYSISSVLAREFSWCLVYFEGRTVRHARSVCALCRCSSI